MARAAKRWRRVWRWTRRLVLGVVSLAVALIVTLVIIIHTDYGREIVRKRVEAQLQKVSPGASIGKLEGSVFGTIVLRDVALAGPDGRPLLRVKTLRGGIDLLPLLSHKIRVTDIVAEDVDLALERDARGKLVIARMIPKLTWSIELENVRALRTHIALDAGVERLDFDSVYVSGSLRASLDEDVATTLVASGWLRQRGVGFAVEAVVQSWDDVLQLSGTAAVGGVRVSARTVRLTAASPIHGGISIAGGVSVSAPRAAVAQLVPGLELPADVDASVEMFARDEMTFLIVNGHAAGHQMLAELDVDLAAMRVRGWLSTEILDARPLSAGRVRGSASVVAEIDLVAPDPLHRWPTGSVSMRVTGANISATATAELRYAGGALVVDHASVVARWHDGELHVTAQGQLAPRLDITVSGDVALTHVRSAGVSVASARVVFEAAGLPNAPHGRAELTAAGITVGTFSIQRLEADALVRPAHGSAQSTSLVLQHHLVQLGSAIWTGTTGRIAVDASRIELRDFASTRQGSTDRVAAAGVLRYAGSRAGYLAASVDVGGAFGVAHVEANVDGPVDVTDLRAWRRLGRGAIRSGHVTLERIDLGRVAELAGLDGHYAGRLDAEIQISPHGTAGRIGLHDASAPQLGERGPLSVDVKLAQSAPGELTSTAFAQFAGISGIAGQAVVVIPDHVFDLGAWRRTAIRSASVQVVDLDLEPALLEQFGLRPPVRASVTLAADQDAVSVRMSVRSAQGELAEITGTIGMTLPELLAHPHDVLTAPVQLIATIPAMPAQRLLAMFGRTEVIGGTISGTLTMAGTISSPTFHAELAGTDLQILAQRRGARTPPATLSVDATWDGHSGAMRIDGVQGTGMLHLAIAGSPWLLRDATATLEARAFDVSAFMMLASGPAGGAAGQLDGKLSVQGLDPATAKVTGELHLTRARMPIAPAVGTLRQATVDVVVGEHEIRIVLAGRLGAGTVKASATFGLDAGSPTSGDISIQLRGVSPIGIVEPDVDADLTAMLSRTDGVWRANVTVDNARIVVPRGSSEALKPIGPPADMHIVTANRLPRSPAARLPVGQPMLIATVALHRTEVDSDDLRSVVSGTLTLTTDGASVGIVGTIDAERGDLDLFGRRYRVERATARFDGSTDPLIDVRITHDFDDVTTITLVHGRSRKPELVMASDPAIYSQGQLLGFLLGGEPHGDPAMGSLKDSATGAGTSLLATRVGGYLRKALPIDLDVLRYETPTSTNSGAITLGTWISHRLFLGYRNRTGSRPDENFAEGELEYWLSQRLVIEATGGNRGYGGVDLLWRRRY